MVSGNGPWPGGGYTVSDVNGASASGGIMGLFLHNAGAPGSQAEGWQATLTGLTPGTTYAISCEWQQCTLLGGVNYGAGDLLVTVNGVPTLFNSVGGITDPWQVATVTFTAAATTAIYQFRVSELAGGTLPGYYGGAIVVDDISCSSLGMTLDINTGSICEGECFDLVATPTGATGPVTYAWDNGIVATNAGPITVCPTITTTYNVTATDNVGNTATASTTITVNSNPTVDLGNDTTVCSGVGASVTLNATNPGATYVWTGGSTNATLNVTTSGNYGVTATMGSCTATDTVSVTFQPLPVQLGNDTIICNGSTLTLDAGNSGATYLWNDNSAAQTLDVSTTGTYYVEVTSGVCTASDTINVAVADPVVQLGNDTTICFGNTVTLDAGNPGASYLWSNGTTNQQLTVSNSGTYWAEASYGACSSRDTLVVTVINVSVNLGNDSLFCSSPSLTLDAGNPGATYLWNDNSTGQQLNVSATGVYWVTATNGSCQDSDTIALAIQDLQTSFFAPITEGCEPTTLNFYDESVVVNGYLTNWYWDFGDGGTSTVQHPIHTYANTGTYTVSLTVTTNLGCTETYTLPNYISIHPQAVANFSIPFGAMANENILFTNTSTNATIWNWNVNDEDYFTTKNIIYLFEESGGQTITLVADNAFGCSDTITKTMLIESEPLIYIPNAFTPDGDQNNQYWTYSILEIDTYEFSMKLFNRWGELIWEANTPTEFWDGTYNGKLVPVGIYTWTLEIGNYEHGESYVMNGHVNVLY